MYSFSVSGKHHNYIKEKNQDAILYGHADNYSAMVLADGVSSCKKAKTGAESACRFVTEFLLKHAERLFKMDEHDISESLTAYLLNQLKMLARSSGSRVEEYSSTLACVLFDTENNLMLYYSIGDSLITATKDNECYIVAMPSDSRSGCCVTTMIDASVFAKVGIIEINNISDVMICSDGAWHLMYKRNRMHHDIKNMIVNKEFEKLKNKLLREERYDDCSFATMDIRKLLRREFA